ncbi:MAG: YraN family protein [Thermomicrobiales bacterium]
MSLAERRAATGASGEAQARRYLEAHGYQFVERNWHCQAGELDLVMLDGQELVFVEVKTRRGEAAGRAGESVSRSKATKLLKSGEWYVATHRQFENLIWRCDLVAITIDPNTGVSTFQHDVNAIVRDS